MTKANDLASLLDANGDVVSSALDNVPASDLVNDTTPQLGGTLDTNTNDINFGTNVKSNYGTSAQLMMYHDGSNGWIKGNNAGNNSIAIQSGGTGSVMISGSSGQNIITQQGDAAHLHYAGVTKANTTATGLDITGTLTANGLTVDGDALHVDATNNRVGIGTSSPVASSLLTLKETNAGGDGAELRLINSSTTVESATQIVFTNTTTDTANSAVIKAVRTVGGQDFRFSSDGSERMRIDSIGNVGIGTSSPSSWARLSVSGTAGDQTGANQQIVINAPTTTAGQGAGIRFNAASGANEAVGVIGVVNKASGNSGAMTFHVYDGGANIPERMRIDSSGNVGIGTTSPAANLEITQSGSNVGLLVAGGGYNYTAKFESSDAEANIIIEDSNSTNDGNMIGVVTNDMYFITNASEAMRIDSSGNVGIGTSSPDRNLHIAGNAAYAKFDDTVGGNTFTIGSNANGFLVYDDDAASYRMVINSSGNVGIGTSSPAVKLHVDGGDIRTSNRYLAGSTGVSTPDYSFASDGSMGMYRVPGSLCFSTGGTERLRIDSSGNLLVGTTSVNGEGVTIRGAQGGNFWSSKSNTTSADNQLAFYNPNGLVGYIQTSGTSTSYVTSSDYRLKTAVTYDWDATTRLKQLNPVRFNFIADPDTTVDGFLAHEVEGIVPQAITGTKDAMRDEEYEVTPAVLDEDGNEVTPAVMGTRSVPDYQGIDQSKLVPLLVKTIQELEARITALEAN